MLEVLLFVRGAIKHYDEMMCVKEIFYQELLGNQGTHDDVGNSLLLLKFVQDDYVTYIKHLN